jgi:hypothetical protein
VVLAATKPGKGVTAAERGELGPVEPLDRIAMDEALRELEGRSETETEATEGGEPYEKYP